MSEGDHFEPAKLISIETSDDITWVTIEVSSFKSFLNYTPHHVGELTTVLASESCPLADRKLIKQACNNAETILYESRADDNDDQSARGGDQVESSRADQKKEEGDKKA